MPKQELAVHLAQQTIYLMGISFILGSLATIFVLLVLEMVRANFPSLTEELTDKDKS